MWLPLSLPLRDFRTILKVVWHWPKLPVWFAFQLDSCEAPACAYPVFVWIFAFNSEYNVKKMQSSLAFKRAVQSKIVRRRQDARIVLICTGAY